MQLSPPIDRINASRNNNQVQRPFAPTEREMFFSHAFAFVLGAFVALSVAPRVQKYRKKSVYFALSLRNHLKAMPLGLAPFADQVLLRKGYAVLYSHAYMSPIACSFIVCKRVIQSKGVNENGGIRCESFSVDGDIASEHRPRVADFATPAGGYHRGHLAARSTVGFSPEAAKETFLLSNVALMTPFCNTVAFKRVEHLTRHWARTLGGPLAVSTGPLFGAPAANVTRCVAASPHAPRATSGRKETTSKQLAQERAEGAPVAKRFFYAVLHVKSGNSIGFIVENAGDAVLGDKANEKGRPSSKNRIRSVDIESRGKKRDLNRQTPRSLKKKCKVKDAMRKYHVKLVSIEELEKEIENEYNSFRRPKPTDAVHEVTIRFFGNFDTLVRRIIRVIRERGRAARKNGAVKKDVLDEKFWGF